MVSNAEETGKDVTLVNDPCHWSGPSRNILNIHCFRKQAFWCFLFREDFLKVNVLWLDKCKEILKKNSNPSKKCIIYFMGFFGSCWFYFLAYIGIHRAMTVVSLFRSHYIWCKTSKFIKPKTTYTKMKVCCCPKYLKYICLIYF